MADEYNTDWGVTIQIHKGRKEDETVTPNSISEGAIDLLSRLTDEQRLAVFELHCRSCGSNDAGCRCFEEGR